MSRTLLRLLAPLGLLAVCALFANAAVPATADWATNSPAPGGNPKEITTDVNWANCTNATKVEVVLYKTVGKAYVEVGRKSATISLAMGT